MRFFEVIPHIFLRNLLTETKKRSKEDLLNILSTLDRLINGGTPYPHEIENAKARRFDILKTLHDEYGYAPHGSTKSQEKPRQEPPKTNPSEKPNTFYVVFFGRYVDPTAGKRGSDKVWGWGVKGDHIIIFWGKTGGTPQTKWLPNTRGNRMKVNLLTQQKATKGYSRSQGSSHVDWLKSVLKKDPKFHE